MIRRALATLGLSVALLLGWASASDAASPGWVVRYPTSVTSSTVTAYVEHPAWTSDQRQLRLQCNLGGTATFHNVAFYLTLAAGTDVFTGSCPQGTGVATGQWWIQRVSPLTNDASWGDTVTENGYVPPTPPAPPEPTYAVEVVNTPAVTISGSAPEGNATDQSMAANVSRLAEIVPAGLAVGAFLTAALVGAAMRRR